MVGHSPAEWQGAARKLWEPMVEMYFFIPGGPDLAAVHTQNFGLGKQPSYRRGCFRRPLRRRSHGASRFKLQFVQQAAWPPAPARRQRLDERRRILDRFPTWALPRD